MRGTYAPADAGCAHPRDVRRLRFLQRRVRRDAGEHGGLSSDRLPVRIFVSARTGDLLAALVDNVAAGVAHDDGADDEIALRDRRRPEAALHAVLDTGRLADRRARPGADRAFLDV